MSESKHWNQGSFGAGVKIGNWNEDMYLKEEAMAKFLIKHDGKELGFHKTDALTSMAAASAGVGGAAAGTLSFGDAVMLEHKAGVATLASLPSVHVAANEVTDGRMPVTGAGMGSNDDHQPITRNVFSIEPYNASQQVGAPVMYGDSFCLRCQHPTSDGVLYLGSDTMHLQSQASRYSAEQIVDLRPSREEVVGSYGVAWLVEYLDPNFRLEAEGSPVPTNAQVVIKHVLTNKLLSCNYELPARKKMQSEFGAEHEITCATKLTRAKVEAPENHWIFKV
jgi:hypothetical protein